MIISNKHKYIFISVPKTGSQTIRDFLLKVDDTAKWNSFEIEGQDYFIREHATAREIMSILGVRYNEYRVIAFIRNPIKKVVSAYYFYKGGSLLETFKSKNDRILITAINIFLAKLLPFKLWALIKKVKSNIEYLTDENLKIIVNNVGRTECLENDLEGIFQKLDLPFDISKLRTKNTSKYDRKKDHIGSGLFRRLLEKKYKEDINFYNSLAI